MTAERPICLVTAGPGSLARASCVGTLRTAKSLTRCGRKVHLLCCRPLEDDPCCNSLFRQLLASGVVVSHLTDCGLPSACRAPNGTPGCGPGTYDSNLVRYALGALHHQYHFAAVVFPSYQAVGFRSIQARLAGSAFGDVNLVVRLDGVSSWLREAEKRWCSPDDMFLDYCEQYAFENADLQLGPAYLLDEVRRLGWEVRPDAQFPPTVACSEVVFVSGPGAEAPRGAFLEAVKGLAAPVPITIRTGAPRQQVMAYLAEGDRLAVFGGPSEVLAPEVIDCVVSGTPFLAAQPRWLPGAAAPGPWFFDGSPADLLHRLRDRVQAPEGTEDCLAARLVSIPVERTQERGGDVCSLPAPAATLAVTYYNLGKYLPETLASLAAQTWRDLEVLIVDDGSTCETSCKVWEEQKKLYPHFRFISQPNAGLGAARNRALSEARGEYFIPVDADNIAAPHMVESFLRGMRHNPHLSAMTCFFLAFEKTEDIARGKFLHQYCPTGGPHLAACFFNVYGDAMAVFRASALRAVGGFETDRSTYCHDWETFVKLVGAGHKIGVIPDYLFYYRRRRDSLSSVMTKEGTDLYPFAQRMLTLFARGPDPATEAQRRALWAALAGYFAQTGQGERAEGRRITRPLAAARRSAGRLWRSLRRALSL